MPHQTRGPGFALRYLVLFGGEAFSKVCVLLAFAYLARTLSPSDYGTVELALSVTMFFVLGVESGMGSYGARVVAAHPEEASALVPRVALLRALLGLPAFLLILAVAAFYRSAGLGVLAVNGLAVLLTPFLTQWVFQGLRQMHWVAAGTALRNMVFVALVLALVRPGSDIRLVALSEVGGIAALAAFNVWVLGQRLHVRMDWTGLWAGVRRVFGEVWSLGLSDFMWACLWYAPAIALGWMSGGRGEQVAWIAASVRIVNSLHTFVFLYFFNLLPNLAKAYAAGVGDWRQLVERSMRTAMWPAVLLAVGGTLIAPLVMPMVYGANYAAAVRPFQLVVWILPVAWFSGHYRFSLIAAGSQRWEFAAAATAAVVVTVGAVLLSARFGSTGAAAALLGAGVVNAVLAQRFSERQIGHVAAGACAGPALAAGMVSLGVGFALRGALGILASTTVACSLFLLAAVVLEREVRRFVPGLAR